MCGRRYAFRLIFRFILVFALFTLLTLSSVNVNRKLGSEYPKFYCLYGDGFVYGDGIYNGYDGNFTNYGGKLCNLTFMFYRLGTREGFIHLTCGNESLVLARDCIVQVPVNSTVNITVYDNPPFTTFDFIRVNGLTYRNKTLTFKVCCDTIVEVFFYNVK